MIDMEDFYQHIRQHYTEKGVDSTELFRFLLSVADKIGRDAAFAHLERCVIEKRLSWLKAHPIKLNDVRDPVGEAYRLFFQRYLGVSVPDDGEIVERSETKLVMKWWNHCPTLEACNRLNLDTRDVCLKVYHKPVQELFSRIHPRLLFVRNYDKIRPHAPYCEEMIVFKNSEMSYTIKPAENHHVDVLPSIERAAAEMFSQEDLPLKYRSDVTSRDDFKNAKGRDFLWVAVDEQDVPVGFLLADIVDGNFHIKEIDVLPDLNGRGIGTRLLQYAYNAACGQGYKYVTLTTFEHIAWNAPFYRRRGFSVMEAADCGEELSAILLEEKNSGLKSRVAMCKQCSS